MLDPTSRYMGLETAELTVADAAGDRRVLAYLRRRFIPATSSSVTLVSHPVSQGERLDHLAARYFGDPTQFWRICDANNVLRPDDLVERPGHRVDIPLPGGL